MDLITYQVTATRDGDWWSLVAEDVQGREVASQSRRLDQADAAIREAIALVLAVDADSFDVNITPDLTHVEVPTRPSRYWTFVVPWLSSATRRTCGTVL